MATRTYGDLQDRIQSELQRQDLSAEVRLAIQSAITFYEPERFYFSEARSTRNTEADKQYYPLPSDFQKADWITVLDASSSRHSMVEKQWASIEEFQTGSVKGLPAYFAQYANELRLYPIPDASYRLEIAYVKNQGDLSATSDYNAWTNDAEELIRMHAKVDLWENQIRDMEQAQIARRREIEALEQLRSETSSRQATGTVRPYVI